MAVTYFKRFRMEIDLVGRDFNASPLPFGYEWHTWRRTVLADHAETKFRSFHGEIDANVFPCLGDPDGCCRLMNEISHKAGFLPGATWLLSWQAEADDHVNFCGTVQGIRDRNGYGAIQNLGVIPDHRGLGLGKLLMQRALRGFQRAGLRRSFLEVTAQNRVAVRLYEQMGFRRVRTVYKAVESEAVGV